MTQIVPHLQIVQHLPHPLRSTKNANQAKKHKRKTEKKFKKNKKVKKEAKRLKKEKSKKLKIQKSIAPQPILPIHKDISASDEMTFGPALPPHLLNKKSNQQAEKETVTAKPEIIGPELPSYLKIQIANITTDNIKKSSESSDGEDHEMVYGPSLPTTTGKISSLNQTELEQRALELKIAVMEGRSISQNDAVDSKIREEWMLELPEVGLKSGLAALSNMKRTFHQGKEKPDFSDRSAWTKNPLDGDTPKATTSKTAAAALKDSAQERYERERDAEQERIAHSLKKKHKRKESLVEIHQKKKRKEEKKKAKELAASGSQPERRPFSRDVDLKLNKIDSNQTKQIVDKAKLLNSKFATGKTKYL